MPGLVDLVRCMLMFRFVMLATADLAFLSRCLLAPSSDGELLADSMLMVEL